MKTLFISAIFILSATTALAAETFSKAGWESAFSRRDFRLGISLTDMRAIPFPDQKEWPGARLVCSNDELSKDINYHEVRTYSDTAEKMGLVKCIYFWTAKIGSLSRPMTAGLVLGSVNAQTEFWFIKPDTEPNYLLYEIKTAGPAGQFAGISQAFESAYGRPTISRIDKWQNKAGASFNNAVFIWRNAVSEIQARNFGETIQKFEITHRSSALYKILSDRMDSITAANAKKL